MRYHRIPDETVQRLPFYLRGVLQLAEQGVENISSRRFAEQIGVHPWQIRKDLSYFGEFGKPGVGYRLESLARHIKRILKLHVNPSLGMFIGNVISVALTTYLTMPLFVKTFGWWFFPKSEASKFKVNLSGTALIFLLYAISVAALWHLL